MNVNIERNCSSLYIQSLNANYDVFLHRVTPTSERWRRDYKRQTSTTGIAFVDAACRDVAYGWTEGINLKTFAHMIGRTLGSGHRTADGIMKQGPIMNFKFLSETVQEFHYYIDSSRASRITNDPPTFDVVNSGCSAAARSRGQCLTGRNVPSPLVPCSPIQGNFYCLTPVGSGRFLFVDCPDDGFKFYSSCQ